MTTTTMGMFSNLGSFGLQSCMATVILPDSYFVFALGCARTNFMTNCDMVIFSNPKVVYIAFRNFGKNIVLLCILLGRMLGT